MEVSSKMSNFFKPKDFKDFKDAPAPVQLPDGSYEPVLNDTDLKICSRRMILMDTAPYSYATQNSPACAFSAYYALRKIYGNDEDGFNAALLILRSHTMFYSCRKDSSCPPIRRLP